MSKFDRKTQQLKARVQFIRGTVRKHKGATLSDDETATMTDDVIENEIGFGTLEAVDRVEEGEAKDGEGAGDPNPAPDTAPAKRGNK